MNELAVSIGVILFPGLIATVICDKIASHKTDWRTFKYGIYSFVFGVMCYAFVQCAFWVWYILQIVIPFPPIEPLHPLHVWSIATASKPNIDLQEVVCATLAAPFVAVIATFINQHKLLNKFSRKVGLSRKFGDENLFSYYLNTNEIQWIYIRDITTNHTYEGNLVSWSETDHIQEVVLSDVTVYAYETSDKLYSLPSIYLAKPTGTFVIEAIPASQ